MKGSREAGTVLLDMLVSLPVLVFLLAAMGAMVVMVFRAAFFLIADSELHQEVQMAMRQVVDEARISYRVRSQRHNGRPSIIFYQYCSPDESLTGTFQVQYWVHRVNKVDKLVWRDATWPLTGNNSLAGVDITEFSCTELAPRLQEIRLTGRSKVTGHSYTLAVAVYGPERSD